MHGACDPGAKVMGAAGQGEAGGSAKTGGLIARTTIEQALNDRAIERVSALELAEK